MTERNQHAIKAIETFMEYGTTSYVKDRPVGSNIGHGGHFSEGGWAFETLRTHLETLKNPPTYHTSPAPGTTCSRCNNTMDMLATTEIDDAPAFYTCRCGYVGQIGVGQVGRFVEPREVPPPG